MYVYAIYDNVALLHHRPFTERSHQTAVRQLRAEVNRVDPQNLLNQRPQDFRLMHVGTFDEETGELHGVRPELVAECSALLNVNTENDPNA